MGIKLVSQLEDHLGFWLRSVSNQVSLAFARKLESSCITVAEWVILRTIYEFDSSVSASEIMSKTGLNKGAVSKLITRLVDKELVLCKQSKNDRRTQSLQLAPQAKALVPKIGKLADQNDDEFFDCLTQSERTQLMKILRKIIYAYDIVEVPIN